MIQTSELMYRVNRESHKGNPDDATLNTRHIDYFTSYLCDMIFICCVRNQRLFGVSFEKIIGATFSNSILFCLFNPSPNFSARIPLCVAFDI